MKRNLILNYEPSTEAKLEAFPFQREAVDAIKDLEYSGVFHEQGLGKTKIAIDIALYWLGKKAVDSVIVVTKKGLVSNWRREFKNHSHLTPRLIEQDKRANFFAFNSPARLYLTHYEAIVSEADRIRLFQKTRSVAIILDEAHKIKNPDSKLATTFHSLANGFSHRLILTGTPVANRTYDMWSQIYFLDQGASLGANYPEFKRLYDLPDVDRLSELELQEYETRLFQLSGRIAGFTVRETKDGSGLALPKKEFISHLTDWEDSQYEMYNSYRDELAAVVVREGIPTEDRADELLKRILRLVQIASNPLVVDENYTSIPGKYYQLTMIIDQIMKAGEKVIIWSSFIKNVDYLNRKLAIFNAVKNHGRMSMPDRESSINQFTNNQECRILVATPASAKEGLTLTMANHVIFYDRGFSLDDYLQAQDRIHRISQTKTCYVHNLMMRDSVDEWVDVIIKIKELSAKLAQGDISLEAYEDVVDYDFRSIMHQVLGIDEEDNHEI